MDRSRRDTLLGLVFFGTLAFLLWATVNLTDLSLGRVPPLVVYFDDAGGAQAGTNVMVLGKKVGKVGNVELLYDRQKERIRMTLLLQEPVPLTEQARIEVQDAGVLGGKQIYIDPGQGPAVAAGSELRGAAKKSAFDAVGETFEGKSGVGLALNDTLGSIKAFFDNLNDDQTSIGRLVRRRELYDEVLQTVQRLNGIFESIQKGDGVIGRLVVDRAMRDDALRLVENLAAVSDQLRGTEGTLGLLLNDRSTAQNLRAVVADVQQLVADAKDGKGALGRILRDETLARDLGDAVANLSLLLQRANDPTAGALGVLTSDPETGRNLQATIANLRDVTAALTRSEGAIGILINDKDIGVRLRRIFTQVSRALEDAREAAPIGNFVQVLLGTF